MRTRDPELDLRWGTNCTPIEIRAADGGKVAKNAREELERQLGRSVISSERASDYLRPIEDGKAQELPFNEDKE